MKRIVRSPLVYVMLFICHGLYAQEIHDYQKYFALYKANWSNNPSIVVRKFLDHNTTKYLIVNPRDLSTSIVKADHADVEPDSWGDITRRFHDMPYIKAINESYKNADIIQDAGLTHFSSFEQGAILTVDLCPSVRPLDRKIFIKLINAFSKEEKPVPVALSVTGIWMNKHEKDMKWLIGLDARKEISITWVNHSYNHKTRRKIPLKENFLLGKGTGSGRGDPSH